MQIRDFPYYDINENGEVKRIKTGLILKNKLNRGYFRIGLFNNGVQKWKTIHRLVAETFIPNPYNKKQINHINGVKTDNRVENLEWCTAKENIQHSWKNGLSYGAPGEKNGSAKLIKEHVNSIRVMLAKGISQRKIAILYNVAQSQISGIKTGKAWQIGR